MSSTTAPVTARSSRVLADPVTLKRYLTTSVISGQSSADEIAEYRNQQALYTAASNTEFNREAHAILLAAEELQQRVKAFLEEHTQKSLMKELARAGFAVDRNDEFALSGRHVPEDMRGLLYNLGAFVAAVRSEVAELDDD